jgi:hypothetical protein
MFNISLQLEYSKKFIKHLTLPAMVEQAGKSAIENCMVVVVLALAMVGTFCPRGRL